MCVSAEDPVHGFLVLYTLSGGNSAKSVGMFMAPTSKRGIFPLGRSPTRVDVSLNPNTINLGRSCVRASVRPSIRYAF